MRPKRAIFSIQTPLVALYTFLAMGIIFSQVQADDGCVTTDCHQIMGTEVWVHGPVASGACLVCHQAIEGTDHGFEFTAEKEELCFGCHEENRDFMLQDSIHTPVTAGECIHCHDPHQSPFRFTLKAKAAELCFQCHDQNEFINNMVHAPVASGDCTVCHNPHASPYSNQLVDAPEDLCFQCHEGEEALLQKRHVHEPFGESCLDCHQTHTSKWNNLLNLKTPDLCFKCHQELAQSASVDYPHAPVSNGSCRECHNPHASDFPLLFSSVPDNLCFRCHEELGEYVDAQKFKHGPVHDGDCGACHNPHGSDYFRTLRKFFPDEFYVHYEDENFDLCFECHNRQMAEDEETKTLTGFRDGKRNLHYLHVNKLLKGRSCKACHQVHASSQAMHIRISVPYGSIEWDLPIKFTKTEDGGSCQVGCHSPKGYSRK